MNAIGKGLLFALLCGLGAGARAGEPEVAALVSKTFPGLTAKATIFPGIYALYKVIGARLEPNNMLVDETVTIIANNGKAGWSDVDTHAPLAPERIRSIQDRAISHLPADRAIPIVHGKAPFAFMLISAIDCPACLLAERTFSKSKYSYGVLPTALADDNLGAAADVYCAVDPAAAWRDIMFKRKAPPHRTCDYPAQAIRDSDALFANTRTPTLVFADGEVHQGFPDTKAEEADLYRLIDAKVAAGVHF